MRRSLVFLSVSLFSLTTLGCSDSSTGPSNSLLTPGVARTLAGAAGSEREFRVEVPAGTGSLRVALTGGTGDADLYIRAGSPPTPNAFDCGSDSFGEDEECHLDDPTPGTWYIVVVGFEAYNNVTLLATLGTGTGAQVLSSGVPVSGIFGGAGSTRHFRITVPTAGSYTLSVNTSGGSGDMDLFVRYRAMATVNVADCVSSGGSNNESCQFFAASPGFYYILLYGFSPFDGASLTATVNNSGALRAVDDSPHAGWVKQAIGR